MHGLLVGILMGVAHAEPVALPTAYASVVQHGRAATARTDVTVSCTGVHVEDAAGHSMEVLIRPGSEIADSSARTYEAIASDKPMDLLFTSEMVTEMYYGQPAQLWITVGGEQWRLPIHMPPGCWPRGLR